MLGRLTRDPDVRTSADGNTKIARYTIAVDRRGKKEDGQQSADFISCIAFNKGADFASNYLRQGTKIAISGRIQTGSYTNKDGQKVYTTDVVVEEHEFAGAKTDGVTGSGTNQNSNTASTKVSAEDDGFMDIPPTADEELPWS